MKHDYGAIAGVTNSGPVEQNEVNMRGEEGGTARNADGPMDEDTLLSMLQTLENDSSEYTNTVLRSQRDRAVKDYYQRPYGNEEPGWSQIITSTVADTIEWMLPDILDQFISTDDAVRFDPTRESEVKGAQQATDACNHVFYKQNNGFLILHTAIKDALMLKTCAVHWRVEEKRVRCAYTIKGPSPEAVSMQIEDEDEIVSAREVPGQPVPVPQGPPPMPMNPMAGAMMRGPMPGPQPPGPPGPPQGMGMPPQPMAMMQTPSTYEVKVQRIEKKRRVRVDAFEPENLRVYRGWGSPLLEECPYVARDMEITLSDLNQLCDQLGIDRVDAETLAASKEPGNSHSADMPDRKGGEASNQRPRDQMNISGDDASATTGWLRIEWVLADFDGDGIAERREVYRLDDSILSNEEVDAVPVATGSPILIPHMWDGMSVAETASDLQLLHTELMRGVVNNAYSANNPRKLVMTGANGDPLVDMDTLLDSSPGGHIFTKQPGALTMEPTAFVGNQFAPLFEMVDNLVERRTGVTRQRMGMDPNAINNDRTLGETQIMDNASKQRTKLVARSIAETVVAPMFKGINHLLTSTEGMEKIAFKLRGEFVELDPQEWSDQYDMTINVGLGTGDTLQQLAVLGKTFQTQMGLLPTPLGPQIVTPEQVYNTQAKMLALGGFKNTGDYFTKPKPGPLQMPPPQPPEALLIAQEKAKTEAMRFQAETKQEFEKNRMENERKTAEQLAQNEIQRQNDERDAARELAKINADKEVRIAEIMSRQAIAEANNRTAVITAHIAHPEAPDVQIDPETGALVKPDPNDDIRNALASIIEIQAAPKQVVRDPVTGAVAGVQHGANFRPAVRDEQGNIVGLQ